jgi:hypothetical protein
VNPFRRAALLCGLLAVACAHTSPVKRKAQPDGTYRADCGVSLARCLTTIEEVCPRGYDIVQAGETVRFAGPRELNVPDVTSEVIARCRPDSPMFGGGQQPPPAASAPAAGGAAGASPKPDAPKSCFPGATQACVGAGACKGGQQCLADGTAFGPCDCGPPTAAAPGDTPAPPH